MGGLYPKLRITWVMMLIGTLALSGFPLTAGFYSKDAIIEAVSAAEGHVGLAGFSLMLLIVAAFFTAFYAWRLMFMTFHGTPRANPEVMSHAHESPPIMLVPLYLLAAGALFAGILFAGSFIGEEEGLFWGTSLYRSADNNVLAAMHHVGVLITAAPLRHAGCRLCSRLAVLHPRSGDSGPPRRAPRAALPLPPQQVVFRRDL